MDDFQYDPLDAQRPSFRLLRLLKGNTVDVECKIFHDSISDNATTAYEALSYTWGNTELTECIRLNNKMLWITENLHSALQCLRSPDQDRTLWIDAVCIDQSNKEERSQQVQMMGRIFGSAKRVIFWLGKPTAESTLLFNSLSKLETKTLLFTSQNTIADDAPLRKLWSSLEPTSRLHQRHREGLQTLLRRPWFRRVWILQEVANAQSAIVCSGRLSISARIFALAPLLLDVNTETIVQSVLDIMPGLSRIHSWWSQERDLFNLLVRFRASQATDRRDMVFALLGMSSEPSNHHLLRADYTKSLQKVLYDTLRYWSHVSMISVDRVLYFLTGFSDLHVTYFVPLEKSTFKGKGAPKASYPRVHEGLAENTSDHVREIGEQVADPSLILLERCPGESDSDLQPCYAELAKLQSRLRVGEARDVLQIVHWRRDEQNIRFVIVKHAIKALLILGESKCWRTFSFIVERCTDDKQMLLNNALLETLSVDCLIGEFLAYRSTRANALGGQSGKVLETISNCCHDKIVQKLLEHGADANTRHEMHGSVLQAASKMQCLETVRVLLDGGADINGRKERHSSPLVIASYDGYEELALMLLEKGADVNAQDRSYGSALQAAVHKGHEKLVLILLNAGANVNAGGGPYGNALLTAWYHGSRKMARILLDAGADINVPREPSNQALDMKKQILEFLEGDS